MSLFSMLNRHERAGSVRPAAGICILFLLLAVPLLTSRQAEAGTCGGRFPNPITDVCWTCFFPISIGGAKIGPGFDNGPKPPPVCTCPAPPPIFMRIGVGVTYWSPDRVAEVVRTPMCSPTLGGVVLGKLPASQGSVANSGDAERKTLGSFYHAHWMVMPLLQQLGLVAENELCQKSDAGMDYMFMSEIDPLWVDDELSMIMAPESVLYANPLAQLACTADATKAMVTNFGIDTLYWCSGGQGSLFPLTGNKQFHVGGPDSALGLSHRVAFMMHRLLLANDTSTLSAMCQDHTQPMMRKGQYKSNFMYPVPTPTRAFGYGAPGVYFEGGREFPYKGEDFSMLVWRKHLCCAF